MGQTGVQEVVKASEGAGPAKVLCVLSEEQASSYRDDLDGMGHPGIEFVFRSQVDDALEDFSTNPPSAVIVGMTIGATEGLEFVAMLMQQHREYSGPLVVLPDKGDPFPPMLQRRDPNTGHSSTQQTSLAAVREVLGTLGRTAPVAALFEPAQKPVVEPVARAVPEKRNGPRPKNAGATAFGLAPPPPPSTGMRASAPVVSPSVEDAAHVAVTVPAPAPAVTVPAPSRATDLAEPVEQSEPEAVPAPAPPSTTTLRATAEGDGTVSPEGTNGFNLVSPAEAAVQPSAGFWQEGDLRRRLLWMGALCVVALVLLLIVVLLSSGGGEPDASEADAVALPDVAAAQAESAAGQGAGTSAPEVRSATRAEPTEERPAAAPPRGRNAEGDRSAENDPQRLIHPGGSVTLPLRFEKDEVDFAVEDAETLGRIVEEARGLLRRDAEARLVLGGHTSEEGTERYNEKLSRRRARRVRRMLVSRGVAPERMSLRAYGTARVEEGSPFSGNRRVTLEVR